MKKTLLFVLALLGLAGTAKADVEWTIWEGSVTKDNVQIKLSSLTNIEAGDIIYVYGTGTLSKGFFTIKGAAWDQWTNIVDTHLSTATDGSNYYHVVKSGFVSLLDDDDLKAFAIGNWDTGTITKVSIKKKNSMIKHVLSSTAYDFGQYDYYYDVARPTTVESGDFLYIPATRQTGTYNDKWDSDTEKTINWWAMQFQDVETDGSRTWYYPAPSTTDYFEHDIWQKIGSTEVSAINAADNIVAKGQFYSTTGLYLLHPITSFSIGATGLATFSANQEVTAPASVTAYKATVSGNNVQLSPFTNNVIPANTGAIIAGNQGAVLEFLASSTGSTETSNLLPVASATEVTTLAESGYDLYVLYNNATKNSMALGLGDSDLNSKWGDKTTYSSKVIHFEEEWKGCGWWFSNEGVDYSAYDRVEASFTTTRAARLVIEYSDESQDYTDFAAEATSASVVLDKTKKSTVKAIYFCSTSADECNITLSSVSLYGTVVAEFRKTTSGTLAANKAYLKIASGSSAPSLGIVFDDSETTGINNVKHAATTNNNGEFYDLQGRRIAQPTKGLYIVNGKKIVLK